MCSVVSNEIVRTIDRVVEDEGFKKRLHSVEEVLSFKKTKDKTNPQSEIVNTQLIESSQQPIAQIESNNTNQSTYSHSQ